MSNIQMSKKKKHVQVELSLNLLTGDVQPYYLINNKFHLFANTLRSRH